MNESLNTVAAEIEKYADDVFSGNRTLLQIERHLLRKGFAPETVCITMELIRDRISERKKGNGKAD